MKGFLVLLLANICIATALAEDTYVYGRKTRVHYPEVHNGGIKPSFKENGQFGSKVARNSGNANALFPRILIVAGYDNYEKRGESGVIEQAKRIINGINSHFSTINTDRPVEFLLDGLVVTKTSDAYQPTELSNIFDMEVITNDPLTQKYKVQYLYNSPREDHYRKATTEFNRFTAWINDNYNVFEGLNSHIILHMSPYHLTNDASDKRRANLVTALVQPNRLICSSKPVVLVSDLVGDDNVIYAMAVSYALGVSHAEDKPDLPYFPGKIPVRDSKKNDWKNEVITAVRNKQLRYSCLNKENDNNDDL